jgi:hypothetical protein
VWQIVTETLITHHSSLILITSAFSYLCFMRTRLYLLLLFSIILCGCQSEKDRLSKLWFYTFSDPGSKRDTLLSPASFLLLQQDGAYTRDFGAFEYGSWTIKNNDLLLTSHSGAQSILSFSRTGINSIKLSLKDRQNANFESMPVPAKEDGPNPFSKELNIWRIPPRQKESNQQIRQRLLNHCKFWEAYFSWALVNELATVDVRSTPTNIKIYGNGFALKPLNELPATWKVVFYDEDDCAKANEEVRNIFQNKTIAWAKTDNKYKMFISAFQQLEQYLE